MYQRENEKSHSSKEFFSNLSLDKSASDRTMAGHHEEGENGGSRKRSAVYEFFCSSKFGTFDGVYLSCLLSMFGVIMFLRLGFIIGNAGILLSWAIEIISIIIVLLTSLSMSALCSNGEIREGGAYYIISRSLGPEVGVSVGILFVFGNSVGVSLHILGFVEPLVNQLSKNVFVNLKHNLQLYGSILLFILIIFAVIGIRWLIKMQVLIFLIIILSILFFIAGCFITTDKDYLIVSIKKSQFHQNLTPQFAKTISFMSVFSIFFPAMTGIMAGANISGDLKNPSKSIPVGTIWSVLTAGGTYIIITGFLGSSVMRGDECGNAEPSVGLCYKMIMEKVTIPGWMTYVGIYCACLSSAINAFVGAPRILMSVAKDKVCSILNLFGKNTKKGEPTLAYIPVVLISIACIIIASIDTIAEIVTITYLITYAIINFACFLTVITNSPGWRPEFKFFNKWVALLASFVCFGLVFVTNYIIAIPISIVTILIFIFVYIFKRTVNWGSANQGFAQKSILTSLWAQRKEDEHVKNFKPNILILTDSIFQDQKLITFVQTLKKCYGCNFVGVVKEKLEVATTDDNFYESPAVGCIGNMVFFKQLFESLNYYDGCMTLVNTIGIGLMKPNTVMIKHDKMWNKTPGKVTGFYRLLIESLKKKMGFMVALNFESLDFQNTDPFGKIDVWWIYDDGGLSILIPYLISKSLYWKKNTEGKRKMAPLRLFVISEAADEDEKRVRGLLRKFRLRAIEVICVDKTKSCENTQWSVVSDLMKMHSKNSKLVFCSMPIPANDMELAQPFLEFLDYVSEDMPAMILMRGSGKSVLTWKNE